ncbi:glycosyltransferase family 2 protein [Paracoccus aerodenitrificans]|uniref:glycosyltransferase family 2 protein n=1 Tax=Paracoccus aerodenitrificans TaxID=3017781 RepID=UPI0022F0BEE6|nr:glycosyltransferase family 2 protein [Paracoccus aerodenitrificans]WBU63670.1 glycosyltransferase family 2 protein [Paracoccus aerodenitrificans]
MKILAISTIRNEGPFLLEWIAWHQMIGVTDFLVYSNDCADSSDLLLDRLADHGVLRHGYHEAPKEKSIHWNALNTAWSLDLHSSADWILISDLDEFPVIHAGSGLVDLIGALPEGTDAVALAWRLFGFNGVNSFQDIPVTSQFTRSSPEIMIHPIAGTFFKSFFRPKAFARPGIHRPKHRKDSQPNWVDGSGKPMPSHISNNDKRLSLLGAGEVRELVELHHYSVRSAQSFIVKSERGLPNHREKRVDLTYWIERNFNTQENTAALRFIPQLEQRIAVLKSLPGVAELHDISVAWHKQRFRDLIATPEGYSLYCQILLAQDSAVLPLQVQQSLLRLFGDVRQDPKQDD